MCVCMSVCLSTHVSLILLVAVYMCVVCVLCLSCLSACMSLTLCVLHNVKGTLEKQLTLILMDDV